MRNYIIFLSVLLVSCSSEKKELKTNSAQNDYRKLDTDEQVLKALNDETGNDFDQDDVCIKRSKTFKEFILIGYFAHDRGCAGDGCFYKGKLKDITGIAKTIMMDHGWSDESKRINLAKEFMMEVAGSWETVVQSEHEDFIAENQQWVEPQSENVADTYIATAWIRQGAGMRRARSYYKVQYIFEKDGRLSSVNRSNRFSHEY